MKYPREWEKLSGYTRRLKIPNGWILEHAAEDPDYCWRIVIYDPNHEWEMEDEKQRIILNSFIKDVLIDLAQEKIELLDAYELIVKRIEPKFGRHF